MVVVVSGHSRKIGKSSVVAGLIQAIPAAEWTAVKITTHRHANDPAGGYTLIREDQPAPTDSGRYLKAGARRSYLLRATGPQLAESLPELNRIIDESRNTIIESNRIVDLLDPDLLLMVVDPSVADWKGSALRHLGRVDAFIVVGQSSEESQRLEQAPEVLRLRVAPPHYVSPELVELVTARASGQPA